MTVQIMLNFVTVLETVISYEIIVHLTLCNLHILLTRNIADLCWQIVLCTNVFAATQTNIK